MKISAEDIWPIVLNFIGEYVGEEELEAFKQYFKVTIDQDDDQLVKAGGIKALLGSFFKQNKKAYAKFV